MDGELRRINPLFAARPHGRFNQPLALGFGRAVCAHFQVATDFRRRGKSVQQISLIVPSHECAVQRAHHHHARPASRQALPGPICPSFPLRPFTAQILPDEVDLRLENVHSGWRRTSPAATSRRCSTRTSASAAFSRRSSASFRLNSVLSVPLW